MVYPGSILLGRVVKNTRGIGEAVLGAFADGE